MQSSQAQETPRSLDDPNMRLCDSSTSLCEACRNITLERLGCTREMMPKLTKDASFRAEYDLSTIHGYEYPFTVGTLTKSAMSCRLCALLRKAINRNGDLLTEISRDLQSRFKLSFTMWGDTGRLQVHLASAVGNTVQVQKSADPLMLRLFTNPGETM
jgi:hypothetical protein